VSLTHFSNEKQDTKIDMYTKQNFIFALFICSFKALVLILAQNHPHQDLHFSYIIGMPNYLPICFAGAGFWQ
jgi:hypothetical protein